MSIAAVFILVINRNDHDGLHSIAFVSESYESHHKLDIYLLGSARLGMEEGEG